MCILYVQILRTIGLNLGQTAANLKQEFLIAEANSDYYSNPRFNLIKIVIVLINLTGFWSFLRNLKNISKRKLILTFFVRVKIHLGSSIHFFALRIMLFECDAP